MLSGLHDIEPALESIEDLEEKGRILLALEVALREQYGQRLSAVDYEDIRRRVRELESNIVQRSSGAEAVAMVSEIDRATAELDVLHWQRANASDRAELEALDSRARSLVFFVEARLDRLAGRGDLAAVRLREKVSAIHRSTLGWAVGFLVGAPLLALAVGLAIRRSVSQPVAGLGEAARRLARGEMSTRIEIRSRDEFGALAAQFNHMAEALVEREKEKLASMGRLAAGFAHELNNPLGVMIGYLMIHRRKAHGRLARDLWTVEQEAHRCREIVGELIELSRPAEPFETGAVDLRQLCDEVVAALRESGQVPDARLSVEGAGQALGNRTKLRQVVLNLVKNGAEAAGSGGRVTVRVESSREAVEVAVADDGPGIPAEARSRMFEPFFTTKPNGTGLGLAVSRSIARAHGGDLALRAG
ncbi:MAG TPA: HAMP domain-containing sensor histidine kinase, partial [Anaeromyxobacteraceae bacterium]|nr:HAMP domain-containing sensor histidine kinase [Anaeromyxobacteraceae bacterium]